MTIQIPGIDIEKALDLYDDDEDIFLTVLRSYASNIPKALNRIRNLSAETLSDYAVAIHGIKGTSANIGAEEVRKAAKELEELAKNGNLSAVTSKNEAFLKRADALIADIQNWLKQYDAKN